MATVAEKNYVKESKIFNSTVYMWHFYRLPMKLREGNVFTGVFHSVWESHVAITHDALDFSVLSLLNRHGTSLYRDLSETGTSLYKDPLWPVLTSGSYWSTCGQHKQAVRILLECFLIHRCRRHELTESKGAKNMSFWVLATVAAHQSFKY